MSGSIHRLSDLPVKTLETLTLSKVRSLFAQEEKAVFDNASWADFAKTFVSILRLSRVHSFLSASSYPSATKHADLRLNSPVSCIAYHHPMRSVPRHPTGQSHSFALPTDFATRSLPFTR